MKVKMAIRRKWVWKWFKPRLYSYSIEIDGMVLARFSPTETPWQQTVENRHKINTDLSRRSRDYTNQVNAKLKAAINEEVEHRIKERDRERRKRPLLLSSAMSPPAISTIH